MRAYLALLAAVGLGRLLELRHSRTNQRVLATRGVTSAPDPHFRWMVMLHTGVLLSSAAEVWLGRRPWIPQLAIPMAAALALANALRWWVIRSMAVHWNVRVMDSLRLGVVATGPYQWIRHPNYLAVFVELEAVPLMHSAWVTALVGGLLHCWVLARRLAVEEPLLLANPAYRATMAWKPRFIPNGLTPNRLNHSR